MLSSAQNLYSWNTNENYHPWLIDNEYLSINQQEVTLNVSQSYRTESLIDRTLQFNCMHSACDISNGLLEIASCRLGYGKNEEEISIDETIKDS